MRGVFIFVIASLCSACQGLEPASAPLAQSPDVAAARQAAPSGAAPASAGSQTVGEPLALGAAETAPPTPTVPPSAPPAEKPRHVQLTALQIDPDPAVGASTPVALTYAGSHAPVVKKVCFLWSGDGPYCWDYLAVDAKAGRITRARAPPTLDMIAPALARPDTMDGQSHQLASLYSSAANSSPSSCSARRVVS